MTQSDTTRPSVIAEGIEVTAEEGPVFGPLSFTLADRKSVV